MTVYLVYYLAGYTMRVKHLRRLYAWIERVVGARIFRMIRYLISGGTAAASNVIFLFLLVQYGGMYYLYASILAFVMSIAVSFTLQKFWTFRDDPLHDMHRQFVRYLIVILFSLALNTALIYFFVEVTALWYVVAQVLTTAVIAVINYFFYRYFVFRDRPL